MLEQFLESLIQQGLVACDNNRDQAEQWAKQRLEEFILSQEEGTDVLLEHYQKQLSELHIKCQS